MRTALITAVLVLSVPALALAQTPTATGAGSGARTGGQGGQGTPRGVNIDTAKAKASQEIDRRIGALTQQLTRIQGMKKVSDSFKSTLSSEFSSQISTLNDLKGKISADDSTTTLKTDIQSITKSYRIFALVMPQAAMAAMADRINTVAGLMGTLAAKLQSRLATSTDISSAGMGVAQSALSDMQAKIADATAQTSAAMSAIQGLTPDNGDATVQASNKAALQGARTALKAAQSDLEAARKDITYIQGVFKAKPLPASSAGSAPSTNTAQPAI